MPGKIEVIPRWPPRSLLERVQDVDCLGEFRDVEHAVLNAGMNANLPTPGPTLGIGFQSFGSSSRCTRQSWKPAIFRASSGKALIVSRESPSQIRVFWDMTQYTRTWMRRQRWGIA